MSPPSDFELRSRTFSNRKGRSRWHARKMGYLFFFPSADFANCATTRLLSSPTANSTIEILEESFVVGLSHPSQTHKLGVLNSTSLHVRLGEMGVNNPTGCTNPERGPASGNRKWCKSIMVTSLLWLTSNADKASRPRRPATLFGTIKNKLGWNISKRPSSVAYVYSVYVFPWSAKMIVSVFWSFAMVAK